MNRYRRPKGWLSALSITNDSGEVVGGIVDHRLSRRALINEYRRGRLRRDQVCDAHPELLRAARNFGDATTVQCPICQVSNVVLVTYVFGPRLPKHGRCITRPDELDQYRRPQHTAYVVEACHQCGWHHLLRSLPMTDTAPIQSTGTTNEGSL
jgi:hypothetical protein